MEFKDIQRPQENIHIGGNVVRYCFIKPYYFNTDRTNFYIKHDLIFEYSKEGENKLPVRKKVKVDWDIVLGYSFLTLIILIFVFIMVITVAFGLGEYVPFYLVIFLFGIISGR